MSGVERMKASDESADVGKMLMEAREDSQHADGKASLLLASLGLGFGAILGGQLSANWSPDSLSVLAQFIYWIGVAVAVAAVTCCAWAVWPRYNLDPSPEVGVTFWGHLATYDDRSLARAALARRGDVGERLTDQLLFVSRGVLTKYRLIRAALICAGAAGCILFISIALIP